MLAALSQAEPLVDCFLLKIEQELSSLASTGLIAMFSDGIFGGIVVGASGDLVGVPLAPSLVMAFCSIFYFISFIISIYYTATLWDTPLIVVLSCRSSLHSHPSVPPLCASPLC